jgi:hypothetical protein
MAKKQTAPAPAEEIIPSMQTIATFDKRQLINKLMGMDGDGGGRQYLVADLEAEVSSMGLQYEFEGRAARVPISAAEAMLLQLVIDRFDQVDMDGGQLDGDIDLGGERSFKKRFLRIFHRDYNLEATVSGSAVIKIAAE